MPKVLITPTTLADRPGEYLDVLRAAGFDIVYPSPWDSQLTEPDVLREIPGVTAVLAGMEPYNRRVLQAANDLRVIARVGVGYDAVDVPAATEHGVAVTITPGANHDAVAEHAYALLLALCKGVARQDRLMKSGAWRRELTLPVRGRTLGLIGLGRIGRAVAARAGAFGLRVIAFEPFPDRDFAARHQVTLLPLEEVLAQADFVSLHLPLSTETRELINRRTLGLMKPSAFLINTSRGGLVDEADLVEALKSKRIAGAGLDVFCQEPCLGHELFTLENVVATPHTAGTDTQSVMDMALMAARSIALLHRGEWPDEQVVNPAVKDRFVRSR